jgi:hypothetical protein
MTSSGPDATRSGPGRRWPARGTGRLPPGAVRRGDLAVGLGSGLYLLFALLPWYSVDAFDLGHGYRFPGVSVNGLDSGLVVVASVLVLLAAAWALLPAVAEVPVPFPRALVTVGSAVPAVLLTLVEWLSDLDIGFSVVGLLTLLSALAVLAFAVLRLLADVPAPGRLPGALARAERWADRPAPRLRGRSPAVRQPAGPPPDRDGESAAPPAAPPADAGT